MSYCPYCGEEASGREPDGVDYCYECERIVEGSTLDFSINTIRELEDYLKGLTFTYMNDTIPEGERMLVGQGIASIKAAVYSLKEKANA
jgi:hypothetical protein